jgi:hypothetical protein
LEENSSNTKLDLTDLVNIPHENEVDPLLCPSCGGLMSVISFIEEPKVINRIIRNLELTFEAERPPPPRVVKQDLLMAAENMGGYF